MNKCIFCNEPLESKKTASLTQKGYDGILRASHLRQDNISVIVGHKVHVQCRRNYCSEKYINQANRKHDLEQCSSSRGPSTRQSLGNMFQYNSNCLFCGHPEKFSGRESLHQLIPIRTMDFHNSIKQICASRNDSWSETVLGRIECVNDLHAADAVYHLICTNNFRTGLQIPQILRWLSSRHCHGVPVPWLLVSLSRLSRVRGHLALHYCRASCPAALDMAHEDSSSNSLLSRNGPW